jgi:tetratricopeptide (TPR) repeat protein
MACNNPEGEKTLLNDPPYDKLTDSIRLNPDADLFFRRGSLLFANGQLDYAASDLRHAWDMKPEEAYALRLTSILKQKSPDSAIVFLEAALKKLPGNVSIMVGLARGYQNKGNPDKALEITNQIINHYPNQLDAWLLKSEILKQQHKDAESLTSLEHAYSYAPDDVELVHNLAFGYADAKNPKVLALADSLIRMDVNKSHAEPHYFKGLYYENMGNASEAIKNFDEAIRRDYYFLDAYMDKGQTLFEQKNYKAALNVFNLAATITPTYAEAYFWMGKTKEALGNKPEAKLDYQRAYGLDKTMTEAKDAADRL